jgi:hypothetical protein
MADAWTWQTVYYDPRACRGQTKGDPVQPTLREAHVAHNAQQVIPAHRIEGLGNVNFG